MTDKQSGQDAIAEIAQNLPAIAMWFAELEGLFAELKIHTRKGINSLETLGEPELASKMDMAMEAFEQELLEGHSMQRVDLGPEADQADETPPQEEDGQPKS